MTAKLIRNGDVALWTECLGDAADPTILLIMGANASSVYWPDDFVAMLVLAGRRVIRYDHRDTGRSTRTDFAQHPYAVADLANDAVAVLDGYGLDKAHVVGMSMGGTLGQILAIEHPSRLQTLTVMATCALDVDFAGNIGRALRGEPSPDGLPTPTREILQVLAQRAEQGRDRAAEIESRIAQWRALSGGGYPFVDEDFRRLEERAIAHAQSHQQPCAHAFATPYPSARGAMLRQVATPTMVIEGGLDPLNPPPHGHHLAELIPGARCASLPRLGHALPAAAHQALVELILGHTA